MTPTVVGDLVYGASCSGLLYALDKSSGEIRWQYDTAQDGRSASFHGDPVVTDELLVISSDVSPAGFVYAFELETGALRWKTPVPPQGVTSHLIRYGSSVLGLTPEGRLMAFDLETGAELWAVESGEGQGMMGLNTHPSLAGDRVYYGSPDGNVRAVAAASGDLAWATDLGARANTAAVIDGDHLVVGTIDDKLYRLALADGSVAKQLELPATPVGTPALTDDSMIFTLAAGYLARVDRSLDGILWSYKSPSSFSSFQPLADGDRVIAGTDDGDLMAFDIADGRIAWSDSLTGTLRGIGKAGGTYYVGTFQGTLYAYSRAGEDDSGEPLWWLAGNWHGGKGDGHIEETWSTRVGDNRMGMFRLVQGGEVQFYEFMSIEYDEVEGPVLRIKHFSKGLRGWEERDDSEVFYLVDSGPREARFAQRDSEVPTRLIYQLTETGALSIRLEKDRESGMSVSEFRFTRK